MYIFLFSSFFFLQQTKNRRSTCAHIPIEIRCLFSLIVLRFSKIFKKKTRTQKKKINKKIVPFTFFRETERECDLIQDGKHNESWSFSRYTHLTCALIPQKPSSSVYNISHLSAAPFVCRIFHSDVLPEKKTRIEKKCQSINTTVEYECANEWIH